MNQKRRNEIHAFIYDVIAKLTDYRVDKALQTKPRFLISRPRQRLRLRLGKNQYISIIIPSPPNSHASRNDQIKHFNPLIVNNQLAQFRTLPP